MLPSLTLRHTSGSWRGFLMRVAVVALAALLVLAVMDWFGISLHPLGQGPSHPALLRRSTPTPPSSVTEP